MSINLFCEFLILKFNISEKSFSFMSTYLQLEGKLSCLGIKNPHLYSVTSHNVTPKFCILCEIAKSSPILAEL